MKKMLKHLGNARHGRRLLAGAGLVLTGATLAAVGTSIASAPAGAAESKSAAVNYVRAANPDAVAGVLLDEEVTIQFNAPVLQSSVGPDTILVRTGLNNGEQARGRYVVGSFMYDRSTQRRVVIRPEAIREYYQMIKGLPREDAARAATSLLRRVESTGHLSLLKTVDQKLRAVEGPTSGTRLDDDTTPVYGIYPPQLADPSNDNDDPLTWDPDEDVREPFRTRIAGDDALWEAYLVGGDLGAYAELSQNSEYERFYHPVDPATGVSSDSSVLRQREYRRVLINRKGGTRVMFVPEIPIRSDLADTAYTPGRAYALIVPAAQPGVYNTVLTREGQRPLLQKDGRDFSTHFTTVPATALSLFRDGESRKGITALQEPRVINQTPPNGEAFVDPTTDWEDPDNQFTVPIPARRTFSIRLRFAQPLDPRTINPANFLVTKIATIDSVGNETALTNPVPVAVGTFLNQHRLGIVEVEITPATNLDPASKYQVEVRNVVASLGGASSTATQPNRTSFIVGPGAPPLDAIRESFTNSQNRADPSNPDTLGHITTAYWPAPALYDPTSSGLLLASFMQFAGTGLGAPTDPRDSTSPIQTALTLTAGQGITFVTENVDPSNPTQLGTPIEYNYTNVSLTNATVTASGRFPLIIRSQDKIDIVSSFINVAGQAGRDGHTNTDLTNGGPTGGLGGNPGVGGYRGGDGACSPLTDAAGLAIVDGSGNFQFDQAKFNGSDGFPSYLFTGGATGGGSGGFSGDREAPNNVDCAGTSSIDKDDVPCTPTRVRESGGGGGHATAGGIGAGARGSTKTHTGGYYGGLGGNTFGNPDFREQPKNGLFGTVGVPRLTYGSGGGGGGGGGAEDGYSIGTTNAADGIANAADSGGGGGGGGGGAVQLVARNRVLIDASVIDASGGKGGRTFDQSNADYGFGAPGGCGAGGSIWICCYGNATQAGSLQEGIIIQNGSTISAAGGDNATSIGYITAKPDNNDPLLASKQEGKGGLGGDGYVRLEDSDGAALIPDYQPNNAIAGGTHVKGVFTQGTFAPYDNPSTAAVEADFQAFPGTPFVVNVSRGFSRWFNAQLDTPSFAPHDDDPATPQVDGTAFTEPAGSDVQIWVRSAPNDTTNSGHPNLSQATSSVATAPWTDYYDVATISRNRFIQFRVDLTVPLSYDFNVANLPKVDFVRIDINLN
jgi:hypothetical protein